MLEKSADWLLHGRGLQERGQLSFRVAAEDSSTEYGLKEECRGIRPAPGYPD